MKKQTTITLDGYGVALLLGIVSTLAMANTVATEFGARSAFTMMLPEFMALGKRLTLRGALSLIRTLYDALMDPDLEFEGVTPEIRAEVQRDEGHTRSLLDALQQAVDEIEEIEAKKAVGDGCQPEA